MHVSSIKVDPYMNVDAGTMAPTEYASTYFMHRRKARHGIDALADTAKSLSSTTAVRWT